MTEELTRRQLLQTLVILSGLGSFGCFEDTSEEVTLLLKELEVGRPIGEAYKIRNKTQSFAALEASLFNGFLGIANRQKLSQHLHSKIKNDYDSEATFTFNSWYLSETEGQLCALITMLTPQNLDSLLKRLCH